MGLDDRLYKVDHYKPAVAITDKITSSKTMYSTMQKICQKQDVSSFLLSLFLLEPSHFFYIKLGYIGYQTICDVTDQADRPRLFKNLIYQ